MVVLGVGDKVEGLFRDRCVRSDYPSVVVIAARARARRSGVSGTGQASIHALTASHSAVAASGDSPTE